MFDLKVIAGQYLALAVAQVHGAALAVAPYLAVTALARLHPFSVTVKFKLFFPDIPEVIGMDVSLIVVTADAKTA